MNPRLAQLRAEYEASTRYDGDWYLSEDREEVCVDKLNTGTSYADYAHIVSAHNAFPALLAGMETLEAIADLDDHGSDASAAHRFNDAQRIARAALDALGEVTE